MKSFRNICDIRRVQPCNRNPTIRGHVYVVILCQFDDLCFCEPSISKHANLIGDVGPVMWRAKVCEVLYNLVSHIFDTRRHFDKVLLPACAELFTTQNCINDPSTVNWWVRIHGAGNTLNSCQDFLCFTLRTCDNRETASPLSIHTKILSK